MSYKIDNFPAFLLFGSMIFFAIIFSYAGMFIPNTILGQFANQPNPIIAWVALGMASIMPFVSTLSFEKSKGVDKHD